MNAQQRAAKENDMTYKRLRGIVATASFAQSMPPDVREQRQAHLQERDRQKRLIAAQADVDSAREAFEKARSVVPETAALEAATKRLAEIEGEGKHDA